MAKPVTTLDFTELLAQLEQQRGAVADDLRHREERLTAQGEEVLAQRAVEDEQRVNERRAEDETRAANRQRADSDLDNARAELHAEKLQNTIREGIIAALKLLNLGAELKGCGLQEPAAALMSMVANVSELFHAGYVPKDHWASFGQLMNALHDANLWTGLASKLAEL